jgi:hypothetical protein
MPSKARAAAAMALASLPLTPALSATELRARKFEPESKWVLDYADERCTLARNFGSGDDTVLLRMDSFGAWNTFHVSLIGNPVPRSNSPQGPGGYRLAGDEKSRDAMMLFGSLDNGKTPGASFTLQFVPYDEIPVDPQRLNEEQRAAFALRSEQPHTEFERSVDAIRVAFGKSAPLELHVGSMAEPLQAMRNCVADLYKSWGMDPSVQRSLSRLPWPLPSTVKHVQRHYPVAALMQGLSAFVPVRLKVDETGQATSCEVQAPQATPEFKKVLCENLAGKFVPALDAAGTPVATMFHTSVIYIVR